MPTAIIAQGAEALLIKNGPMVIKLRIKKSYRIRELDEKHRKQRTRKEIKLLQKVSHIIKVPKVLSASEEKKEIERNLLVLSSKSSNLVKCVRLAIDYATQLPLNWLSGDYHTKQQLQALLFPSGMSYDKKNDKVRTTEINLVFLYIAHFQQIMLKKERGIPELNLNYASFADSVAGSRIELPTSGL